MHEYDVVDQYHRCRQYIVTKSSTHSTFHLACHCFDRCWSRIILESIDIADLDYQVQNK